MRMDILMKKLNKNKFLVVFGVLAVFGMITFAEAAPKKKKSANVEETESVASDEESTSTSEATNEGEEEETSAPKKKISRSSYQRHYGMAGCGVGSSVLTKDSKEQQIGVWIINEVAGMIFTPLFPTWAMSSGTSNCTDRPREVAMEQEVFLNVNLANLSKEAAFGTGEHLDAFAEVLGCQSKANFGRFSQENFEKLFETQKPNEVLSRYLEKLRAHPDFSKNCSRVG